MIKFRQQERIIFSQLEDTTNIDCFFYKLIIDFFNKKTIVKTKIIEKLTDAAPPNAHDLIGQMCIGQDK